MFNVDTSSPVLVTGATGYVAGQIVKQLLAAGVTVHAAVRDPSKTEKLKCLNALAATSPGQIKYFKSDLLKAGSYAGAMAGCSIVFHTASPMTHAVKDTQKELVDPALLGTRNVLEEANRTASVRRVVLTSSCAAISGDNIDIQKAPGGILTEEIWNTSSSLKHQPYSFSKTLAEKEAWKIARQQSRWDLVVINPSLVVGPAIDPDNKSESINIVRQYGDGSMRSGAPRWAIGAVDVRDLAYAHVAAAYTPGAEGRHITSGHNTDLFAMAQTLQERYGKNYPIPKRVLPKWIVWLLAPMVNRAMTRKMVSRNVGLPWKADHGKSIRALGVSYRPLEETMNDLFAQLIQSGAFNK